MGARKESVRKVSVVESAHGFTRATPGRFLACMTCDLNRAEVAEGGDKALWLEGTLSLGGRCCNRVVAVVDLVVRSTGKKIKWDQAIAGVGNDGTVASNDSSKEDEGKVAGGQYGSHVGEGSILVRSVATL